eukprot:Blabericola_migrator_1__4090@NODE_2246_length_3061_cov_217_166333_g1414_i0_p1_GENE_NODE_2246_length_3061_cov_217_166333_g1414_i0NODE_2246_length_3061_cov_217_166333_g1414_i0_p1_ORF_typecomplete_len442_score80_20Nucleoside_tran/PF01733_18/4_1e03Nucleoside_tran/PF01733_18/9_3e33DUF3810/PF12725_7/0_28DUF3341/PF11821_8/2_1e02DUF3341/PF11821_8/0_63DUF3341/PF11821_8/7e02_NODE_2246_length_3061_cov_217_166333_g1414_i03511676
MEASSIRLSAEVSRDLDVNDSPVKELTMTDSEYRVCAAVFVLLGTSALYYWNSVLNTLYSVVVVKYPEYPAMSDTITSSYATVAFVTAICLSIVGPLRKWLNLVGGIVLGVMAILFPVAVLKLDGKAGYALLHVTAVLAGVAEACFQVSGYAFSVILPRQFGGWVSFGYGVCGVITFCLWMLFSQAIFDINSGAESQIAGALWCHMSVCTALVLIAVFTFQWYFRQPVAVKALERALKKTDNDSLDEEKRYSMMEEEVEIPKTKTQQWLAKARQYWSVFRLTWGMQVGMSILMGMSMMAYPLIGPYRWGRSIKENDVLTGIFQVCDFTGRYIPNLSWLLPWLLIPGKLVLPLTVLRGVLLGLFIWIALSTEKGDLGLLQEYWVQVLIMIAMALTHGWYASVYMTRIPEGVAHPKDKAKASAMGVSLLIFMIAVGLWLAKLV